MSEKLIQKESDSMEEEISQKELDLVLFDINYPAPILISHDELLIPENGDGYMILRKDKSLGKGSFGKVYRYYYKNIEYAVKIINQYDEVFFDSESRAIVLLKMYQILYKRTCKIIPCKLVESLIGTVSIMPVMDGNILAIRDKIRVMDIEQKKEILESIREQMESVIRLNDEEDIKHELQSHMRFAYLDLKFGNVLYKVDSEGKIIYLLGDIGSIVENLPKTNPGEFISTYPIQIKEMLVTNATNVYIVKSMRYLFGIFAYALCNNIIIKKTLSRYKLSKKNRELVEILGNEYDNLIDDEEIGIRISMY
jgi:hypothetical protein